MSRVCVGFSHAMIIKVDGKRVVLQELKPHAADFYCSEGSSFRTFQGLVGCNLYLLSARCLFDKG